MFALISRHPVAFGISVVLHAMIIAALLYGTADSEVIKVKLTGSTTEETEQTPVKSVEPMKTFMVDAASVQKQLDVIRQQEQEKLRQQQLLTQKTESEKKRLKELQRKQELEKKKALEARRKAEAEKRKAKEAARLAEIERKKVEAHKKRAYEEKQKAEKAKQEAALAEKKRLEAKRKVAEAEKQRKVEEQKRLALEAQIKKKIEEKERLEKEALKARIQKEQDEEEAAMMRQMAAEESKRREQAKAKEMQDLRQVYISNIAEKVKKNWKSVAKVSDQAECSISITQTPKGMISSVKVDKCNQFADRQFKKDAEKAVYRSEPLPPPPVKELFERKITFIFKP